jgi:hypothetical protein
MAQQYVANPDAFAMGSSTSAPFVAQRDVRDRAARPTDVTDAYIGAAESVETVSHAVHTASSWSPSPAQIEQAAVSYAATDAAKLVRDAMAGSWRLPVGAITFEPVYRFPVLAHWSFTVTADGTFEQYMQNLDVGLLGTLHGDKPAQPAPTTTAGPPPDVRPAPELAETGHVGLDHLTRRGDQVRAWFRGPAAPHPTVREQAPTSGPQKGRLPFAHTSDQLRVVVPDGREDVSYAAAYEIGRLLALSQSAVVTALMRWRQEQFGAQRAALLAALAAHPVGFLDGTLFEHRTPGLGALVGRHIVLGAAKKTDAVFASSRPLVDPGRPLDFLDGNLDQVIAAGLGLDFEALQRNAKRLGIVGALVRTAVQVGAQPDPALGGPAFTGLQADLDRQVGALVAQSGRTGIGGAAADALDDLLADPEERQ